MTSAFPFSIVRAEYGKALLMLVAAVLVALLGGCATGPNANPHDPLEPLNRKVMQFNDGADALVLKPVATVYKNVIPPLMRTGISNFFSNLGDIWSFVNSALQLKLQNAGETFIRLNVNTFFGLGGILDIASELNIERHKEDFGQTLGRWGVPPGPYIVLPLLGPSTLRDTAALPLDHKGDLVHKVNPTADRDALYGLRAVDARSNLLRIGGVIEGAALDKYSFIRDAYLQKRRADIFDSGDSDGVESGADVEPALTPPAGRPPADQSQPQPAPAR